MSIYNRAAGYGHSISGVTLGQGSNRAITSTPTINTGISVTIPKEPKYKAPKTPKVPESVYHYKS